MDYINIELMMFFVLGYVMLGGSYVINLRDVKKAIRPTERCFKLIAFLFWPVAMVVQAYTALMFSNHGE